MAPLLSSARSCCAPVCILPWSTRQLDTTALANYNFQIVTTRLIRVNYDWTISPTLLNSFRVGVNRQHQLLVAPETTVDWGQKLGIPGINPGFPGVNCVAIDPRPVVVELVAVAEVARHAESVRRRKPPLYS